MVQVPDELAGADGVDFEVHTVPGMHVLGRLSGTTRRPGERARPVVLTLRVPSGADAGRIAVADVVFRTLDGRQFVVPVLLDVPHVRDIVFTGPREMRDLRTSDRVELTYRVTNGGNATDTVLVALAPPTTWTAKVSSGVRLVIAARATLEVNVRVLVPLAAQMGDHVMVVSIRDPQSGESLAHVRTTLGVVGKAGKVAGLALIPSVAYAASSQGSATSSSAVLEGPVAEGIHLRAQVSPRTARGGLTTQGLASVGAMTAPFAATLSSGSWNISAGNIGTQLSDLSGVSIMGEGVTGELRKDRSTVRGIVARPPSSLSTGGGLLGAGVWRETDRGRIGAQLSSLTTRGGVASARELTSIGVDYLSPELGTLRLGGGVAHRTLADASAVGYALSATHESSRDRASVAFTHAPGGTAAFARAVDEFRFDAGRMLTDRWYADVNALKSHDGGAVFSSTDVSSWSVGNRFDVRPDMTAHARLSSSRFTARANGTTIGAFGAAEQAVVGGVDWNLREVSLSAEGSVGTVSRSSELSSGRMHETTAPQRAVRVSASRMLDRLGALSADASLESTAEGVGLPGEMLALSARWTGIPVVLGSQQLRVGAEASYQQLGGLQRSLVTRATVDIGLPFGLSARMSAERNPFFRDAAGRAGWIAAVRVSAVGHIFTPEALGPEGLVFEDRNLNGRRDAGEPGVGGVVVRRGDARTVTGKDGRYRLPVRARGRTRIDQGSLPIGLVAHPLLAADTLERADLPVLPTGTVTVRLVPKPDERGRLPDVDLRPAIVMLRDERGFEWVGRRIDSTTALFEGMPSGQYTLHLNLDRLTLPLRNEGPTPVVIAPHSEQTVDVPLHARAMRVFIPDKTRRHN